MQPKGTSSPKPGHQLSPVIKDVRTLAKPSSDLFGGDPYSPTSPPASPTADKWPLGNVGSTLESDERE